MEKDQTPYATQKNEFKNLGQASLGAMVGVFFSRASGVFRTLALNAVFGLGVSLDAFHFAFRFPNALRDLLADGSLSASFVKVFVEEKQLQKEKILIEAVIGFFFVLTTFIATMGALFSYPFLKLFSSPAFERSGSLELASFLFKILSFYLPFTMLNAIAVAVLSVFGRTFRAMNGSIFLNVGILMGVFCVMLIPSLLNHSFYAIITIGVSAMVGVFLQTIYQYVPLYQMGLLKFPRISFKFWLTYRPLHHILRLMVPRTFAQGLLICALMINTFFALHMGSGVLSYIVTATLIIQVPVGLFGVATGFAAHPLLSQAIFSKDYKRFALLLTESLETTLWLSTITLAGLSLFIVPFYCLIFQYGKVTFDDTIQNSLAVCAYSTGIIFATGSKVLLNGFYALSNTKQIVYNAIVYLVVNVSLTYTLAPTYGILGLGLSYGTANAVDFFMNFYFLNRIYQKDFLKRNFYEEKNKKFIFKIFIFSCLSYFLAFFGILKISYFWKNFKDIFLFSLNAKVSFFILCAGGTLFFVLTMFCVLLWGPETLKIFIKKLFKHNTLRS